MLETNASAIQRCHGTPPKLRNLDIEGCSMLEENCTNRSDSNSQWSKISHISKIKLDENIIQDLRKFLFLFQFQFLSCIFNYHFLRVTILHSPFRVSQTFFLFHLKQIYEYLFMCVFSHWLLVSR